MNRIRAIVHLSCRGYRGAVSRRRSTETVKREIEMVQPHMPIEPFGTGEGDDPEDLDEYASDFSTVGEFNEMHDRELEIRKLKLKNQIVKRKYFKSTEPATLTFGEQHQIRLLHTKDPEEWSVERLSESFPASQDAIAKVLRAQWWPKSTKTIENYNKKVKDNWDLFKKGQLRVEPHLQAHLEKFKNREIKMMEPEEMEKFLKPKSFFPKPKSTMFSNIIKGYLDEKKSKSDETSVNPIPNPSETLTKQIASGSKIQNQSSKRKQRTSMTHDMFLKNHIDGLEENNITPISRVILDEHKRQQSEDYKADTLVLESQQSEDYKADTPVLESQNAVTSSKKVEQIIDQKYEKLEVVKSEAKLQSKVEVKVIDEHNLETGIIARHKKKDSDDNYPEFIKIPRKSYKRGATYKIENRYYDDDGTFLYRVIGLEV